MGLLAWIVFGAIAGWIANALMGKRGGCFIDIIVGIIGAFVGGMVMKFLGGWPVMEFDLRSLAVAVLGAVLFIALLRALRRADEPAE